MALHFHLGFLLFLFALAISGVASAPVLHRKAGHAICNESTWAISGYVDEGTTPCAATSASIVQTKRPYFSRDRSSTSIGTALDTPDSRGVSDDMLATSQTAKLSLHRRGFLDNIGNAFKVQQVSWYLIQYANYCSLLSIKSRTVSRTLHRKPLKVSRTSQTKLPMQSNTS